MVIDTASGNTWLPTPACNDFVASPACMAAKKYDSAGDAAFKKCTGVFCLFLMPLTDGNQTLLGTLGNTSFSLGGLAAPSAALGMVSLEPLPRLSGQAFDGVVGAAFQNGSTVPLLAPPTPLLNVLLAEGQLAAPTFSLFLNRGDKPGAVGRSAWTLGGADAAAYSTGPLVTLPPAPIWQSVLGLWAVVMDYVFGASLARASRASAPSRPYRSPSAPRPAVNAFLTTACDKCIAVLDSSTPYISGPPTEMAKVLGIVGPVAEDCSNVGALPNITFQLGGVGFALAPSDYVLRLPKDDYNTSIVCTIGLQGFDSSGGLLPLWILGTSFLRSAYSIYHLDNATVQLAQSLVL